MNPIFPNINLPTTFMKDKNISDRKLFTVSFEVYRGKKKIHYYYMKKSDKVVVERQPGRKVELSGKSFHSRCLKI